MAWHFMQQRSISSRLSMASTLIIGVLLGGAALYIEHKAEQTLNAKAMQNLESTTHTVVQSIETLNDALADQANRLVRVFASSFKEPFSIDVANTVTVGDKVVPVLRNGSSVINLNFSHVDEFSKITGGNATVFIRQGEDFIRIATSVKKENGDRAVGTALDHASPAYAAMRKGEVFVGKVTLFGKEFMTNYTPIKDGKGEVIGILYIGFDFTPAFQNLKNEIKQIKIGSTGFVYALDAREGNNYGTLMLHPSIEGKNLLEEKDADGRAFIKEMLSAKKGVIHYNWASPDQPKSAPRQKIVVYEEVPHWNWIISAGSYQDEFNAEGKTLRNGLIGLTVLLVVVVWGLVTLTANKLVGAPLMSVVQALKGMAEGNYRQPITKTDRADEIGQLFNALAVMQQEVRQIIQSIIEASSHLTTSAAQLARGSEQVVAGSREQTDSASSMAQAIEELTVSISHVNENALEAHTISAHSGELCQKGSQIIHKAANEMGSIATVVHESSERIITLGQQSEQVSSIISIIKEIADQTNLLALNASIEAARAGEQGRGFAVVADEVRKLSERTAQSTQEISETIKKIREGTHRIVETMSGAVKEVDHGVTLAHEAGDAITDIEKEAARVVEVVSGISAAIREQSIASSAVAGSVEQIARMAERNSTAIEYAAASAQGLEALASQLQDSVQRFKI